MVEKQLNPAKVLVWCLISKNKMIDPYFFNCSVNGENYLDMLKQYFLPDHKKQKLYRSYYFQQDGALGHRAKPVQAWLEQEFGNKFVKKDMWPPRLPDLNYCDFFYEDISKIKCMPKSWNQSSNLKKK